MGIVGIGVIGRCTLKILGPFEVSYIPPGEIPLAPGSGKWEIPLRYRSQVIGGKLLIGQLAPWVTWGI